MVLQAVVSTIANQAGEGLLSIADLPAPCGGGQVGTTPLLHFLYKSLARAQVIMPAFVAPLDSPGLQQVLFILFFLFGSCIICANVQIGCIVAVPSLVMVSLFMETLVPEACCPDRQTDRRTEGQTFHPSSRVCCRPVLDCSPSQHVTFVQISSYLQSLLWSLTTVDSGAILASALQM